LAGFNDLASSEVGGEYDGVKTQEFRSDLGWRSTDSLAPQEILRGSRKRVYWLCSRKPGHSWVARIDGRTRKENATGCPYCAGTLVDPGVNDIASKFPELASEWSSANLLAPSQVAFGSHTEFWWRCVNDHRDYLATPHNRCREDGTGCPDCNTGGFETSKPSYLYFIKNVQLSAYKIGIANSDSKPNRLNVWKALGWEEIRTWESQDGRLVFNAEKHVLKAFIRKELNLPQCLSKDQMQIGSGQKETFAFIPHIQNAVEAAISNHFIQDQDLGGDANSSSRLIGS